MATIHKAKRQARARLEFRTVLDQVTRRRDNFVLRLERHVRVDGDCRVWTGAVDANGYARINFRLSKPRRTVKIGVHRVFLILQLGCLIPVDKEAGHFHCHNRLCVKHVRAETRQENLYERDRY